jgi:putative MATE family efflux protein
MNKNRDSDLTRQPIPKLIKQLAIPASVGYFFNTMYNVVDTFFGGLISTQVLAALSLSLPVFFIIIAVGTGLSTGTTALIGNALGAGNREEAKLLAIQGVTFSLLLSIVLTFIGIYSSPFLFSVLGASGEYMETCLKYMKTIFWGTLLFMLVFIFNAVLTAQGDTKTFRNFLIAGFILNILLDPWFIYGGLGLPPLGVLGIALATVLIHLFGCLYLGIRVLKTGLISREALKNIFPKGRPFMEIARQGLPASINMMTLGVGVFVITYFISEFGKEAVAAYGVAIRVEQIVILPAIGLNIATLAIIAQNNGAKLIGRIEETINHSMRIGGFLVVIGMIGVLATAPYLMTLFSDSGRVVGIGTTYLRIDALVFYAYLILFVYVAAMQGMKRPMFAIWIGLYRQIIAPFIIFYVLIRILDFGLTGIWWGIFSIAWSAALFTLFYTGRSLNQVKKQWAKP